MVRITAILISQIVIRISSVLIECCQFRGIEIPIEWRVGIIAITNIHISTIWFPSTLNVSISLVSTKVVIASIRCREIAWHSIYRSRYRIPIGCIASNKTCFISSVRHIIACKLHKRSSTIFISFSNCKGTCTGIGSRYFGKYYYISSTCLRSLYLEA